MSQSEQKEVFDLVDENDEVIGSTDKKTAHSSRQLHRVAAVFVFDTQDTIYVQIHKASGGLLDHSVGGHLAQGETYKEAAVREADEELGIRQPLTELATSIYSDEITLMHFYGLYECVASSEWRFVPNDEVDSIVLMDMQEVRSQMESHPEKFTPGFIATMDAYCKVKGIKWSKPFRPSS